MNHQTIQGKMESQFDTTTQEYIEIIHHLQNKHKVARVKDIARHRGVTRSSVSTALNLLKKKNLIKHENYGLVELTEEGEQLGQTLDERHAIINKFFISHIFKIFKLGIFGTNRIFFHK